MQKAAMLLALTVLVVLAACSEEAQTELESAVERNAPTLEAALQTRAPTLQAAAQQAGTQVVDAIGTNRPTLAAAGTQVAGAVDRAAPTLRAAADRIQALAGLALNTWQWTGTTGADGTETAPDDPTRYTLDFRADGTVAIQADCNSATATASGEEGSLAIAVGAITAAECPEGSLSTEFVAQLGQVESFQVDGETLDLTLADGGVMTFQAAPGR